MREHGIDVPQIEADGEFHRLGLKKCQWYVANQRLGDDGRVYYVASFGDWKTGLSKTKSSGVVKRATPEERSRHRQIIDEMKTEIEAKRLREQETASEDASESFYSGVDHGSTQYMKRKGIDQLYGCRIRQSDHALMVPMRDGVSSLVGIQQIFDDGSKYFWPGQKTKGCFHLIGQPREGLCYVVEGFATGVTIHRATGSQVAVAFSAHNLEDVALYLQSINLTVRLAADNDQFTDGNPGLAAAQKLKSLGVEFVFPKFKDLTDRPTDFNDLERLEGIEEVRAQIYADSRITIQPVRVGLFELPEGAGDDPGKQSEIAEMLFQASNGRLFYDPDHNKWWGFDSMWRKVHESDVEKMVLSALEHILPGGFSYGQFAAVFKLLQTRISRPTPIPSRSLIPFLNGFLNIETKEFKAHTPDVFLDWHIPCDRTDEEDTPACNEILHNLSGQDSSSPDYDKRFELLLCFLAATLRGMSHLQKFLELIGEPGSGKSTYMQLATMLVGKENTQGSSLHMLDKSSWETGLYFRKRLVIFPDESDWGGSGDRLKSLVGGDPLRNEEKYGRVSANFIYDGMVIVSANNYIRFADKSHALVRRRVPIKIDFSIPEGQQDKRILERVKAEVPALINCLLNIDPKRIERALSSDGGLYKDESINSFVESNPVAEWLKDRCEEAPGFFSPNSVPGLDYPVQMRPRPLYNDFISWCDEEGIRAVPSAKSFGRLLSSASKVMGWRVERSRDSKGSRSKGWMGIRVI
jgi:putative DNA primase/helicase